MAYEDLYAFVESLERHGELKRIALEVDPDLEITEITDRVCKKDGPALLFERVRGSDIPVLMNAFGSMRRMCLALQVDRLDEIGADVDELLAMKVPERWAEKLGTLPKLKRLLDMTPKTVTRAPCQEVVETERPSLEGLPILRCWPGDGGRFITLPVVVTKDPETGIRNAGMYRMHVFDDRTTGMHWHPHKGGAQHYRIAEHLGHRLEVAVALGPDPAVTYAATAPVPDGMDEFAFAGFLRKARTELVKCVTVDLEIPANAQIVLEGYVEPGERRQEGPFGDHTGFYSPADLYPVFRLTAVTRRERPIYPATVVGKPPMEDCFLGKATERIFLPALRRYLPEIVDMNLPVEGVFHNLAIVSIDKRYPGHARKVMHALWGMGQMMLTKIIVVLDREVDVHNLREVLWRVGNAIDPQRDIEVTTGPADVLDHAAYLPGLGSKMGIDATRPWPDEGFDREWPDPIEMSPEVMRRVDEMWDRLGL